MVICVPSGITAVEQRAVKEAGYQAGARRVYIIEEPMAAAIGAGLPVHRGHRQHGRRRRRRHHRGRGHLARRHRHQPQRAHRRRRRSTSAIIAWMKKEHALHARRAHRRGGQDDPRFGLPAARRTARPRSAAATWSPACPRTVDGRLAPRCARRSRSRCTPSSTRSAVTLDQTPPELAGDIMDRGIVLTGGGALLRGLDERLRHETGMPVHVAEDPLTSVALGAGSASRSSRRSSRSSWPSAGGSRDPSAAP